MSALHCWEGRREHVEAEYGYMSDAYLETLSDDWKDGICLLPSDHEGPHVWTPTSEIRVRFADESGRGGGA